MSATETPPLELAPLTVTAHPAGGDERIASFDVRSLSANERHAVETRDLFAPLPGLQFERPGGAGGRTTLFLRGAEENHTLVFLDGIPLQDPTNARGGAVDFSMLEPASLGQIAVVRGPASVRYGPEALAGVIHLESPNEALDAATLQLGISAGGDALRRAHVAAAAPLAPAADLRLFASATTEGRSESDESTRIFHRLAGQWRGAWNGSVTLWRGDLEANGFPDDSGGSQYAVIRTPETREQVATGVGTRWERSLGEQVLAVRADYGHFSSEVRSPGVAPGLRDPGGLPASEDSTTFERSRLQVIWESPPGSSDSGFSWALGADAQEERGRSEGFLDFGFFQAPSGFRLDRSRVGGFAEGSIKLPHEILATLGGRLDRFSGASDRGTVRAGLAGPLGARTSWRLAGGNVFKPPSFYAVAHPLVGNPDLRPETGEHWNAALIHALPGGRGTLELHGFSSSYKDGIDFDPGPPPSLVNRSRLRIDGVEIVARWRAHPTLELLSAFTWLEAEERPSGDRLRGRPRWTGSLVARWTPHPDWETSLSYRAVGSVLDTSIPTGEVVLDERHRLDLTVHWTATEQLRLFGAIDNLTDSRRPELVGFTPPGLRLRGGLRAKF